jgi:hypothetical protein
MIIKLSKKARYKRKTHLERKKVLPKIGTVKGKPMEAESIIVECYYMELTGLLVNHCSVRRDMTLREHGYQLMPNLLIRHIH